MNKDELTKNISFIQTIVSLLKDVILIIVLLLSSFIVYLGGNPEKLSVLDWTKIVSSAILLVICPLIIFFIIRLFLDTSYSMAKNIKGLIVDTQDYPDQRMKYILIFLGGIKADDNYKTEIDEFRKKYSSFSNKHPHINKMVMLIINISIKVNDIQRKYNPYFFAALTLVFGLIIYFKLLKEYFIR